MSFKTIRGQEKAKKMLQQGLLRGRVSHAYIFSGPPGTGKRKMALALAQSLFCVRNEDDACGECAECRKLEHGNHPHLHHLEPDGTSIKIEQIRELQRTFSFRQEETQYRVCIICQADKMTVQAANSLLKFLEEPHRLVVAILISDNGQAILPTLRSRSQWIPFLPLPPREMENWLCREGFPPVLVRPAVHLQAGLEGARELIQSNEFAEMRNVVIQLGKECLSGRASASIAAHMKVFKPGLAQHVELLLDLFTLWLKDMIHLQCGRRDSVVFTDQTEWMAGQAAKRPVSHWVRCMDTAVNTRKKLRLHAQPQLALEQFMFQIQGG